MDNKKKIEVSAQDVKIDILGLYNLLYISKKIIVKTTLVFFILGLFVAIFSAKEFSSSVTMVPQFGDNSKSKMAGLAGIAAMAGFGLNDNNGNDILPPTIYPQLLENVKFKKDLMYSKIKLQNSNITITLYDYFTNDDYQPFSLFRLLQKYTIGLPGVIMKAIKEESIPNKKSTDATYVCLTPEESSVAKLLSKHIGLEVNEKEGTLVLSANMPEAEAAAQVVENARLLLQQYIIDFKINKISNNLDFIKKSFQEAKIDYVNKQLQLANFQDNNRNVILASTRTQQERLSNELSIALNVYADLAKQLEQMKIKVKDETPVLTVIKPAVVPLKKSKPNRILILFAYCFIGFSLSVLYVFTKNYLLEKN